MEKRQMRGRKFVRRRTGLIGLLIMALVIGPTLPVVGGGGFFKRRATRSHGSSGAYGGSWGSHGATGGGRVIYTQARPIQSGHMVVQRTQGAYASHGAAGGSPASHTSSQQTARAYYPANRIVVRRSTTSVPAVANASPENTVGSTSVVKVATSQINAPPTPIVPAAPNPKVLARFPDRDTESDLADADLYPLGNLLATLNSSPTKTASTRTTIRHSVMKPATLEVPAIQSETDVELDASEFPPQTTPNQAPNQDAAIDEAPTLEATERQIEKEETIRSVQIDHSVPVENVVADTSTEDAPTNELLTNEPVDEILSEANSANEPIVTDLLLATEEDSLVEESPEQEKENVAQEQPDLFDADKTEEEIVTTQIDAVVDDSDSISASETELLEESTLQDVESKPELVSSEPTPSQQLSETDLEPSVAESESQAENIATNESAEMQSILIRHSKEEKNQETVSEQDDTVQKSTPWDEAKPDAPSALQHRARLVLHVPESAEVFLMNQKMSTMGTTRLFNLK